MSEGSLSRRLANLFSNWFERKYACDCGAVYKAIETRTPLPNAVPPHCDVCGKEMSVWDQLAGFRSYQLNFFHRMGSENRFVDAEPGPTVIAHRRQVDCRGGVVSARGVMAGIGGSAAAVSPAGSASGRALRPKGHVAVLLLPMIIMFQIVPRRFGRAISIVAFGRIHDHNHNVDVALPKHLYCALYRLNRVAAHGRRKIGSSRSTVGGCNYIIHDAPRCALIVSSWK